MSVIKKFFEKRKLNIKFKKAGAGHRLDEPHSPSNRLTEAPSASRTPSRHPSVDSDAGKRAADAALARLNAKQSKGDGTAVVRARMRTEIEAEKRKITEAEAAARAERTEVSLDGPPMVTSILYCCPEITDQMLPKEEMEAHIHEFLLMNLAEEPEMTSALMIHTLNKNSEKVKVCIETLVKYLDNIVNNPGEEKFQKIRIGNKVFQERVSSLQGTEEFMQAAGFVLRTLPHEDHEENFWVLSEEMAADVERLKNIKSVLLTAEPIKPHISRDLKVFYPSKQESRFEISDDFYSISPAELKKEQQRREEATEKLGMLRTKAMRERDEQRELRKYRFTLIRVKFPNGIIMQGLFKAQEKLSAIKEYVGQHLVSWLPFFLITSQGQRLTEDNLTLAELGLAPASLLNFSWDQDMLKDMGEDKHKLQAGPFLKEEFMSLIQEL